MSRAKVDRSKMASGAATVLVVGSGGREHALGAALAASPQVGRVEFAGGPNAGLEAIASRVTPEAAGTGTYDLVVIGPEAPLVDGLADRLRARGLPVFGPSAAAAQLEASKAYTKAVCEAAGVPTAKAAVFDTLEPALSHVQAIGGPQVVKADGLAAGKGVVVAATAQEAAEAVRACFSGSFGAAGARVVIEERLVGPEVSLFALADGTSVRCLATARDYKRAYDGDTGPNTGGMGAVSPAPGFSEADADAAMAAIVEPVIAHLKAEGVEYRGVLYAGLMLTADGPKLIEFNVRFGDPECQAILPRLESDPFALMLAVAEGRLADAPIALSHESAVAVVVAADGYPGPAEKGEAIGGLNAVAAQGATLYHAATLATDAGVTANGGRVLAAVSLGRDAAAARGKVYAALDHLDWPGGRYRRDIAA